MHYVPFEVNGSEQIETGPAVHEKSVARDSKKKMMPESSVSGETASHEELSLRDKGFASCTNSAVMGSAIVVHLNPNMALMDKNDIKRKAGITFLILKVNYIW